MKKRLLACLLTAMMLVSLFPLPALAAEDPVNFLDCDESGKNWQTGTCDIYTTVTEGTNEWEDGWYVVEDTVNIGSRVTVSGDVHLILANGCTLHAPQGINVSEGNSLTIYAQSTDEHTMGKLTANAAAANAGIGGFNNEAGGTITINGGTVTATGRGDGAGIGGGWSGNGGRITINGGTVEASSSSGAGIGGGRKGNGGTITINGGKVTATNTFNGAGIGGGGADYDSDGGDGGEIIVTGGAVTATSSTGAGIGGGSGGEKVGGAGGDITISGGTVTASGSTGAGIGGGGSTGIGGPGGKIIITGGTVTATSSASGAGIGGGGVSAGGIGASGTFITGPNGSAFIVASKISDQSGKDDDSWSGVIFEGLSGNVYGSEITLTTDATIPANRPLEVGEGQTLIIGEDVTLTNNGTIENWGTIENLGMIDGQGTITENEIVVHEAAEGWKYDGSSHWHPCAVEDCTAHKFDTAAHDFGAWTIDQEATSSTDGSKSRTCRTCQYKETQTIPATGGDSKPITPENPEEKPTTPEKPVRPSTPVTPTYPPTVEKPGEGGGTPAVTPSNPKQGSTVTVTPKPDDGYETDKVTVTDRSGKPVAVTQKADGTYTFQQPGGKVTIQVTYRPIARPWSNPFADVSESDWYYEAVGFVQERGLMNGYSDSRFGPNDTLSRAQLAQILFNKEGRPVVNYLMQYGDVTGEAWYAEAVRWATSQGIVSGYGNGTFGPNDPITREQLAVMLWRYSGSPAAANKELRFSDESEISGFALEALRWAVENGILNGYSDGRLGPQGQATRAQAAQMLKNFIENQEYRSWIKRTASACSRI